MPKTKRSRRTIDIGDQLLGLLSRWRRERHGESAPPPEALIVPSASGGPIDPDNLRHRVWAWGWRRRGSAMCGFTRFGTRTPACSSPSCQVHLWRPGTGLITHTSYIGEFAGPYPFREHGQLID